MVASNPGTPEGTALGEHVADSEDRELLTVNMGPQHTSTLGVLGLELVLDG
jgi:NADH:ubiquinone oxidoreductase subunit D